MANSIKPAMKDSDLVARILLHAGKNYYNGGWDYLVECYEAGDILLLVAECETVDAAIAKLGRIMAIKDEQRREIQSTAW